MFDSKTLDDLTARIGRVFESSPAKDIEKNVKALLASGLSRLDVVTREEFDRQLEVLKKTREKVEALEARVAALEAGGASHAAAAGAAASGAAASGAGPGHATLPAS